jgi:hypothetical protein
MKPRGRLKRTRLRQVSDKRREKLRAAGIFLTSTFAPKPAAWPAKSTGHRIAVDVKLLVARRSQGLCELQLPGCRTWADQHQHRVAQKHGGRHGAAVDRSDRASNLIHSCGMCHHVVTVSPAWSKRFEHGWSLEEWQDSAMEPVLYRGGELVYLADDGSIHSFEKAGA